MHEVAFVDFVPFTCYLNQLLVFFLFNAKHLRPFKITEREGVEYTHFDETFTQRAKDVSGDSNEQNSKRSSLGGATLVPANLTSTSHVAEITQS